MQLPASSMKRDFRFSTMALAIPGARITPRSMLCQLNMPVRQHSAPQELLPDPNSFSTSSWVERSRTQNRDQRVRNRDRRLGWGSDFEHEREASRLPSERRVGFASTSVDSTGRTQLLTASRDRLAPPFGAEDMVPQRTVSWGESWRERVSLGGPALSHAGTAVMVLPACTHSSIETLSPFAAGYAQAQGDQRMVLPFDKTETRPTLSSGLLRSSPITIDRTGSPLLTLASDQVVPPLTHGDVVPATTRLTSPELSPEVDLAAALSGVPVRRRTKLAPLPPSSVISSALLDQFDALDRVPTVSVDALAAARRTDSPSPGTLKLLLSPASSILGASRRSGSGVLRPELLQTPQPPARSVGSARVLPALRTGSSPSCEPFTGSRAVLLSAASSGLSAGSSGGVDSALGAMQLPAVNRDRGTGDTMHSASPGLVSPVTGAPVPSPGTASPGTAASELASLNDQPVPRFRPTTAARFTRPIPAPLIPSSITKLPPVAGATHLAALNNTNGTDIAAAAHLTPRAALANSKPLNPFRKRVAMVAPPDDSAAGAAAATGDAAASSAGKTLGPSKSGAWARRSGLSALVMGVSKGAGSMGSSGTSRWARLAGGGGSGFGSASKSFKFSFKSIVSSNASWLSAAVSAMTDATRPMLRAEMKVRDIFQSLPGDMLRMFGTELWHRNVPGAESLS